MITPIDQTSRVEWQPQMDFVQRTMPVTFADRLVTAKAQSPILKWIETSATKLWSWIQKTPALRGIREFLVKVFRFIKYDVLFLFNDEEEELIKEYQSEIGEFYNLYNDMLGPNTDAGRRTIKKNFYDLSRGLQKLIKDELYRILQGDRRDLSSEEISKRVSEVLSDPFKIYDEEINKAKMEGNVEKDARIQPLSRAIMSTISKL